MCTAGRRLTKKNRLHTRDARVSSPIEPRRRSETRVL